MSHFTTSFQGHPPNANSIRHGNDELAHSSGGNVPAAATTPNAAGHRYGFEAANAEAAFQYNSTLLPVDLHGFGPSQHLTSIWSQVQGGHLPPPPHPSQLLSLNGNQQPFWPPSFFPLPSGNTSTLQGGHVQFPTSDLQDLSAKYPLNGATVHNPEDSGHGVVQTESDVEEGELLSDNGHRDALTASATTNTFKTYHSKSNTGDQVSPSVADWYDPKLDRRESGSMSLNSAQSSDLYVRDSRRASVQPKHTNQEMSQAPSRMSEEINNRRVPDRTASDLSLSAAPTSQKFTTASPRYKNLNVASDQTAKRRRSEVPENRGSSSGGLPLAEKREQAKHFLALMHAHNYRLPQLASEGLDVELLRDLYRELGLSTGNLRLESPGPSPTTGGKAPQGPTTAISTIRPQPPAHPPDSVQFDSPKPIAAIEQPKQPSTGQNIVPQGTLHSTYSSEARAVIPTETGRSRDNFISKSNEAEAKVPQLNTAKPSDIRLERKDYIARLLAEKSRKDSSVAKPTEASRDLTASDAVKSTTQASSGDGLFVLSDRSTLPSTQPPDSATTKNEGSASAHQKADTAEATQKATVVDQTAPSPKKTATAENVLKAPASSVRSSSLSARVETTQPPSANVLESKVRQASDLAGSEQPVAAVPLPKPMAQTSIIGSSHAVGQIPGLFMTASTSETGNSSSDATDLKNHTQPDVSGLRGRKRPIASDFADKEALLPSYPHKRPYGQSRFDQTNDEVIIEVSDDETGDSEMDIDEVGPPPEPAISSQSSVSPNATRKSSLRDKPTLPDFPPRASSIKHSNSIPSSLVGTPSATQTPASVATIDPVRRAEEEISAMKRKIAELEQRRKAKAGANGAQTPPVSKASIVHSAAKPNEKPQTVNEKSVSDSRQAVIVDQSPLSSITTIEVSHEGSKQPEVNAETFGEQSEPKDSMYDWKRRRRAEIESGLPELDAGVALTQARLAELKQEMRRLEAENQRRLKEKEILVKELESLGIDTDGVPHAELQAKRDELVRQGDLASSVPVDVVEPTEDTKHIISQTSNLSSTTDVLDVSVANASSDGANGSVMRPNNSGRFAEIEQPESISITSINEAATDSSQILYSGRRCDEPSISMNSDPDEAADMLEDAMDVSDGISEKNAPLEGSSACPGSPPVLSYSTNMETDPGTICSPIEPGEVTPMEDVLDNGHVRAPDLLEPESGESTQRMDDVQPASQDDVTPDDTSAEAQAEGHLRESQSPHLPDTHRERSISESRQSHDSQLSISVHAATDPAESLRDDAFSRGAQSVSPLLSVKDKPQTYVSSVTSTDATSKVLVIEDQPKAAIPETAIVSRKPKAAVPDRFSPYESPLKAFKAYRYHPQFTNDVSGGYRSMTYSHNIDPNRPLCQFEAAGGTCNDDQCAGQHFRAMSLSDDMILVRLGTSNPGRTPAEEQQWNEGLKLVLKDLRQKNTKDLDIVATEIANYRRRFLKDPTKILNL